MDDDATLADDLARGDRAAAAEVYRRFAPALRAFVGRIIRDHALAEDVVHDVMIDILRRPERFDPNRGSLRSWLLTLAHRRAIDRIRSIEAARKRDHRIGVREHHSVDAGTDQWDALFDRSNLRAALAQLSAKQREAVTLRYLQDRTHSELAQILGVATGTAKTRVRDGLLALRSALHAGTNIV
jgi:RNA polymerase sigma-70 factor, ECF subfamily